MGGLQQITKEGDGGRLVGYARVSTSDQRVEMQTNALLRAGVAPEDIFSESASGVKKNRPQLAAAMRALGPGDTLVVWKLDRIARSMLGLLKLLEELEVRGVKFRSITESFDTDSLSGRLIVHMLAALAEFERGLIRERTQAGIDNRRAQGVKWGARKRVSDAQIAKAYKRVHEKDETRVAVAKSLGITTHQLARRMKEHEAAVAAAAKAKKKPAAKKKRSTKARGKRR